jgi:hypothetical protein
MRPITPTTLLTLLLLTPALHAQTTAPTDRLPFVHVDLKKRQIRVDCEALNVNIPLEFFCVTAGGNEHESVLRTPARPSHIHLALLMLGEKPGEPVKYSEAAGQWFPPHGPPLHISVEYQKDGKTIELPANQLMRSVKTKAPMPPLTWIFAGSRILDNGVYGADPTGYVVSICNFDLCLIDVPALVSSANETLEWERNPDTVPPTGTPVTMIIEPTAGPDLGVVSPPSSQPAATQPDSPATAAPTTQADPPRDHLSPVSIDQAKVDRLRARWEQAVMPHAAALKQAAQAQYEVITELRREQQRLVDEADRIQRTIDDLEKQYQDMTTPQPDLPSTQP